MHQAIMKIMDAHNIDRSSVIKLALYHFINHTNKSSSRNLDIFELVKNLEEENPPPKYTFSYYCE